jgi:hypothetical protein
MTKNLITKYTHFDTDFEKDCIALEAPDEFGNFDAFDSDRVICQFNIKMVINSDYDLFNE